MGILTTKNLAVGYDRKTLIDNINMDLESGKILTLIGPNGAGKSTILRSVSGLLKTIDGIVTIEGNDLKSLDDTSRARLMSVMLTEKKNFDYATCRDVISVGRYPHTNILGKLSAKDEAVIDEVTKLTGVNDFAGRDYNKISDGQRQRVLLARALVQEPKVLILDEPTSFLDVGYKIEFMNILKKLAREKGIGILMSLHELDLAAAVSDKIISITRDNKIDRYDKPGNILSKEYISKLFEIKDGSYSLEKGFEFCSDINSSDCHNISDDACLKDSLKELSEKGYAIENIRESDNSGNNIAVEEHIRKAKVIKTHDKKKKPYFIMVQGTMSSAGKSLVVAGLCRIFKQDGYKVAPFKSQNMALNSYITADGLEMGRAQVMQAEAAGILPSVYMNPILLKPTDDQGSQVIVNGKVRKNMRAREYFEYKTTLIDDIKDAVNNLAKEYEIIVIEGAGSPAEINLKKNDIVNMGMAKLVNAPVLLVGDIDRGGVFAQLLGTVNLLEDDEKKRVKGLIINKFRGDKTILNTGIDMLEDMGKIPVVGVLPYMDINLEDEDSLTERFEKKVKGLVDIAVVRLPHISNFTDFDVFEQVDNVSVRYVTKGSELNDTDLIILPGSKNTISDMRWLKESGIYTHICKSAKNGIPVFGICGGFQMLGRVIKDPLGVEGGGEIEGLSLLDVYTTLAGDKCQRQVQGEIPELDGILRELSGKNFYGYEIHMGETVDISGNNLPLIVRNGNIYGTYIHGIFDHKDISRSIIKVLFDRKNIDIDTSVIIDYKKFKDAEYDRLADTMRQHLDMENIYRIMGIRE